MTGRYTLGVRCATQCRVLRRRAAGRPGPLRPRADHDHRRRDAAGRARLPDPRSSSSTRSTTRSRSSSGRRRAAAATRSAEAVAAAQAADAVVMVLGLSSRLEGEEMPVRIEGFAGGDRTSLDLPKVQQAADGEGGRGGDGQAGRPRAPERQRARGRLGRRRTCPRSSRPGTRARPAGTAVADVLFGDVEPGRAACRSPSTARSTSCRPSTTTR